MTTEWIAWLGLVGCAVTPAAPDPGTVVASSRRANCELAARRCSRCHPYERVLGTRLPDATAWEHYVDRMRLMPGSGIASAEVPRILDCVTRPR